MLNEDVVKNINKLNNEKDNINLELSKKANKEHKHNVSDIEGLTIVANAEDINYTNIKNEEISNSKQALDVLFTDTETSKKSILDIENLVEAENIKCTTNIGEYTIENSKKGYLTNFNIQGKTLVNIIDKTTYKRNVNTGKHFMKVSYSLNNFTIKNYSNLGIRLAIHNSENIWVRDMFIEGEKSAYIEFLDGEIISGVQGIVSDGWSETDKDKFKSSCIIIEGDYTTKDIKFFEGLESVGQGNKIEILSYKSDGSFYADNNATSNKNFISVVGEIKEYECYKYDKKIIPYTLRSLPGGVRDEIVYKNNTYKLIQKCEEITINGQENWTELKENATNETLLFNAPIGANINGQTNNTNIWCDKFKPYAIWGTAYNFEGIYETKTNIWIRILKSRLATQDLTGFKIWLNNNNITLIRQIETKEIELGALSLEQYDNQTRFICNTSAITPNVSFESTQNLGSHIEVIRNDIRQIKNTLSNTYTEDVSNKLLNGWSSYNDTYKKLTFSRNGNVVTITGSIKDGLISNGTIICKIPNCMIPKFIHLFQVFNTIGTPVGLLFVNSYGDFKVNSLTSNTVAIINAQYILD
ncbi:hypothetical protein KWR14_006470 [Clostridioides difficile]|nr:hypothetical protein [uncultured Clostridioides sp.]EGT5422648.1 hypothetical protein [Clostridioides difficile]MBH7488417.1 hypothetical protein [Clostridioides difficile]MBY0109256.1 hypothetical protein [Clostridioides difficile]MBY1673544.1 hypothetical protein [Clostridioides difficile]MBY1795662.1 hypothetical protein [Clostridioides difficile]